MQLVQTFSVGEQFVLFQEIKTESIRFIIQGYLWCAVFKIRMEEKMNTIGRFIISPLIANNIIIFLVIAYILISSWE